MTSTDSTEQELRYDFQKEEFRYLTGEIRAHVDEQFKLERYVIVGIAAVYAWLLTTGSNSPLVKYGYWVPPVAVLFSILRTGSLYFTLEGMYSYQRQ